MDYYNVNYGVVNNLICDMTTRYPHIERLQDAIKTFDDFKARKQKEINKQDEKITIAIELEYVHEYEYHIEETKTIDYSEIHN